MEKGRVLEIWYADKKIEKSEKILKNKESHLYALSKNGKIKSYICNNIDFSIIFSQTYTDKLYLSQVVLYRIRKFRDLIRYQKNQGKHKYSVLVSYLYWKLKQLNLIGSDFSFRRVSVLFITELRIEYVIFVSF